MSLIKKFKEYIALRRFTRRDVVIIIITALLLIFCLAFRMPFSEVTSLHDTLDLTYQCEQINGGYVATDSGHSRLISFSDKGAVRFLLENIKTENGDFSYIDDIYADDSGIYVSACIWDEMAVANEAVIHLDNNGNYVETVYLIDHSDEERGKRCIYGLSVQNGSVLFAECRENKIIANDITIPYENAVNAVSDVLFFDDSIFVLDKSGIITKYSDGKTNGDIIYSSQNDDGYVVPYKLAQYDGNIYFTDIANNEIRLVSEKTQSSLVVADSYGSFNVGFTESGDLILSPEDGIHVIENDGETYFSVLSKNAYEIAFQILWFICVILCAILIAVLALRIITIVKLIKLGRIQRLSCIVLAAVAIVAVIICTLLTNSFADEYSKKIREQVEISACTVAAQINGDDINDIEETGGFGGASYNRLCDIMERSFPMDIPFCRQVYCNILKIPSDGSAGYAVAYLDQSVGAYYPLNEEEQTDLITLKQTGDAVWNQNVEDVSGTYIAVKVPVTDSTGEICGAVAVGIESYVISNTISEMMQSINLSLLVMLMLVWIVSVEIIMYISNYGDYRKELAVKKTGTIPWHILRILVFLIFAAYNMTASFLPAYLMHKAEIFKGAFASFAGALPITINLFLIGVMSLFCNRLINKLGFKRLLVVAALCSLLGNLIIFIFPYYYTVFAGLVLDGIGVGLGTNAVYVLISCIGDTGSRTRGLSIYNSAYLSGINFGMITGSLLAVTLNRQSVFFIVCISWAALALISGLLLKKADGILGTLSPLETTNNSRKMPTHNYISDKKVLGFMALVQNPYIIFSSFVFYYVPLFCDANGYGESLCTLFIMIYSQTAVLLSNAVTAKASKRFGTRSMYLALILNIAAMVIYALTLNIGGMILALIIMGISSSFGKPLQQTYYLNLKATKTYGADRAMGIYNFSENIGESLGPSIFAGIIDSLNIRFALVIFSASTGILGMFHKFISREDKTK